jgi:hypothetical protein
LDSLLVGAVAVGIGSLLVLSRAHRPDLGDVLLSDRATRLLWGLPRNWTRPSVPGRESRTWWTGETRSSS